MSDSMAPLDDLISHLQRLPTIGPRTARRLALHLLQRDRDAAAGLATALSGAIASLHLCRQCRQLAADDYCGICSDSARHQGRVCVVETLDDLLGIEQSGVFDGRYFVLNGALSPLDGIGPAELAIPDLLAQVEPGRIEEVILALSLEVEGEATARYLLNHLPDSVPVTRLAQGVPMGSSLSRMDPMTLGRAVSARVPVDRGDAQ